MDSKKIEELLARYWNCETSLEEEQQLKEYFSGTGMDTEFKEESLLFTYFSEQRKRSLAEGAVSKGTLGPVKPARGRMAKLLYNTMRIAAGIAVVLAAIWFIHSEVSSGGPSAEIADTYNDPQRAFEETKKALLMISKSFGTAEEQARKINLFNEARDQIQGEPEKKKDHRGS